MSQAEAKHHHAQARDFRSGVPRPSPDQTAGHGGLMAGVGGGQMHLPLPFHLLVMALLQRFTAPPAQTHILPTLIVCFLVLKVPWVRTNCSHEVLK